MDAGANPLSFQPPPSPRPQLPPLLHGTPGDTEESGSQDEVPSVVTFVVGERLAKRFQLPVETARRSPLLSQLLDSRIGVDTAPEDDAIRLSLNPQLFAGVAQYLTQGRVSVRDSQEYYGVRECARYLGLDNIHEDSVEPIGVRMELKSRRLCEEQCDTFVSHVFSPWIEQEVLAGETQFQFFVMPDTSKCKRQYPNVLEDALAFRILQDTSRRGIWLSRMEEVTGMRIDVSEPSEDGDGKSVLVSTQVQPACAPHVDDVTSERDALGAGDSASVCTAGRLERRVRQLMNEKCDAFVKGAFIPWVEQELEQGKTTFVFYVMPDTAHCDEKYQNVMEDEIIWNILEDPIRRAVWVGRMEELTGMRVHIGEPVHDEDGRSVEISTAVEAHQRRTGEGSELPARRMEARCQDFLTEKCDQFCKDTFVPWVEQEVERGAVRFHYFIVEDASKCRDGYRNVLDDRAIWNILEDPPRRELWVQYMEKVTGLHVSAREPRNDDDGRSIRLSTSVGGAAGMHPKHQHQEGGSTPRSRSLEGCPDVHIKRDSARITTASADDSGSSDREPGAPAPGLWQWLQCSLGWVEAPLGAEELSAPGGEAALIPYFDSAFVSG
eukprot:TRINITY_DN16737_c0_g1_i1.p1 TRINITY_DN16737_c0_g1~~TRINITY_DN16737_c0_g1_i1.p1  ORF type:complete len:608 (+),score=205.71 TRINITY_DN16737_c0_g1_i1:91-1914(+)